MTKLLPLVFIALVSLAGCSNLTVTSDEVGRNFAQYSSYHWHKSAQSPSTEASKLIHDDLIQIVDKSLTKKNYRKSTQAPDFYVSYQVTAEDTINFKKVNVYSGYGPGFVLSFDGQFSNETYVKSTDIEIDEYRKGKLILDIIDADSNKLIWRSVADKKLQARLNNAERLKLLNTAIKEMLKPLPRK